MSNKSEPPGQQRGPSLQNLMLYVPPHHSQSSAQPPTSSQSSSISDHQMQELNSAQIRSIPPRLLPADGLQSMITDKKSTKEELAEKSMQHIQYQNQIQNGISLSKDAIHLTVNENPQTIPQQYICKSIGEMNAQKNCVPNMINNTFSIGIQNLQAGQRLVQNEIFHCAPKINDKLGNGNFASGNVCGNSYLEMNHETSSVGGNVLTLTRSESVRSETGESCSSMSSGDSQSDCSGNILVLPSQLHSTIHGQQILGQNQIVLNLNSGMLNHNHGQNNIVIAGNSNAILSGQIDGNQNQNYQLLEHNMTQQQIVNQSISIVNHQIKTNRGGSSGSGSGEGQQELQERSSDSVPPDGMMRQGIPVGMEGEVVLVNNMPHQFVRTPNGIMLGVMPGAKQSVVGSGVSVGVGVGVVNGVQNVTNVVQTQQQQHTQSQMQVQIQSQPHQDSLIVTVPQGWNRIISGSSVVYLSPSGAALCSLDQVREYLQAAGTCKCGLDCPVRPECTFNFDPKVTGKPHDNNRSEPSKSCCYKKKLLSISTNNANNSTPQISQHADKQLKDFTLSKKRKRKANPYSGVSVSQLIAQRDNVQLQQHQHQHQQQHQQQQKQLQQLSAQNQQEQFQQINKQNQLLKERVWNNSNQIVNMSSSPQPNQPSSPVIEQNRFNASSQVFSSISSENISITTQQNNQMTKNEFSNNVCNANEMQMQGRNQMGSQVLTINGNLDPQNKYLQQQIVFSGNQNNQIRRLPSNFGNGQIAEFNHIIGPNGQIVGIQTSSNICRSQSLENITGDKCVKNSGMNFVTNIKPDNYPNMKVDCKIVNNENAKSVQQFPSPNIQFIQNGMIIPSSQSPNANPQLNQCNINMGTNNANMQQLTPEVIQKINQQQQIFIQQNQKQMELAMKGIKTQIASNSPQPNLMISKNNFTFNDGSSGTQTSPQGALIVTNNSVMVANQQKMPPWQLNRMTKMQMSSSFLQEQHVLTNKSNSSRDQSHIDESVRNVSLHTDQNLNQDNQGMISLQNMESQNVFSRVPPLHHHTPQSVWPEEVQQKKSKSGKSVKKTNQRLHRNTQGLPNQHFNNPDGRKSSPDSRAGQLLQINESFSSNPSPSFMDDPSGYLAQQTALLNNTISRQVGFNNVLNNSLESNSRTNITIPQKSYIDNSEKNNFEQYINSKKCDKNTSNNVPSQSNIPDSSIASDKSFNIQQKQHCQGCLDKTQNENSCTHRNVCDQQMQNSNFQFKMQNYMQSMSSGKPMVHSLPGTPSPNQILDDSPVTSTFIERPGSRSNMCSDLRGPIQGGIVSTSNGSPMETFALPELSPTPSNCSRNTDTPQSKHSGSVHVSSSCPYTIPSPAYSNQSSSRESMSSNPATPSPGQNSYAVYSSPGPMLNQSSNHLAINTQINNDGMNSFTIRNNTNQDPSLRNIVLSNTNMISNEQLSMNSDNGSQMNQRRITQSVPGYYLPSHMGTGSTNVNQDGQMMFINSNGLVTTMASGHTLSRNTITSVLAGKAQTATTSINASASLPFSYSNMTNSDNVSNTASPVQNKNLQFEHINVPSDYPMHIAGNLSQNIISKSPLEMVQSVVSSIQVSQSGNCNNVPLITQQSSQFQGKNIMTSSNHNMQSGHILMPSNGQFLVTNGNQTIMAPPPPKNQSIPPLPPLSSSPLVTSVTASMSQAIPAVGNVQQVINQPTVLVNTLPSPFMLQPQVMTVDGQVVNQNVQMPQIVTGNLIHQGRIINDGSNSQDGERNTNIMARSNLLSPDSGKKKGKKRKAQNQPVTSMLHIAAQHSPGSVLVQHNSQQQSQFSPQGFQVSPNSNLPNTPMLQALTIVPGKPGTPAHIVMNGQGGNNNFGSQQIITNSQGPQHINLLQPVNLLNSAGVVQNFPAFQQFIVPGLGSMVMTADGTAILQDTQSMPMQLQIQNVNGQNVLTPVQNQGILTAGTTGMVIRTQTPNSKIIQSQHSPGAQFLSPNGNQIVMSGSPFNGQLSPMVANVSPNHSVTFSTSPQQVRPNIQQEFIQCNQMGQALMLPLSPNQIAISSSSNQQNTTFVQQNTTIVQQQTTMVSNNHNNGQFQNNNSNNTIVPSLNIDQGVIINQNGKPNNIIKGRHNIVQIQNHSGNQIHPQQISIHSQNGEPQGIKRIAVQYPSILNQVPNQGNNVMKNEPQIQQILTNVNHSNMLNQQFQNILHPNVRHSVSTQTLINQQNNDNKSPITIYSQQISGSSPPDTTTHSPLGTMENSTGSPTNSISGRSSNSSQGNQVDTTGSPEPNEHGSLPMVHCVSSSEPDSGDRDGMMWGRNQNDTSMDMSAINYYQKLNASKNFHQNSATIVNTNNQQHYEKMNNKNNGMMNNMGLDLQNYHKQMMSMHDNCGKHVGNELQRACNEMEDIGNVHSVKRINISSGNEASCEDTPTPSNPDENDDKITSVITQFKEGDLVWGPAKGFPAWPGKLVSKNIVNGVCDGTVLVRWFGGDKCLSAIDPLNLKTLSDGLEAHHAARTKCRKSRKLNSQLERAIQEAMSELDRISEGSEATDQKIVDSIKREGDSDINGNSSKMMKINMKGLGKSNSSMMATNSRYSDKSKSSSKCGANALSNKMSRGGSGIVKIAPHPMVPGEVAGRLRSSHR